MSNGTPPPPGCGQTPPPPQLDPPVLVFGDVFPLPEGERETAVDITITVPFWPPGADVEGLVQQRDSPVQPWEPEPTGAYFDATGLSDWALALSLDAPERQFRTAVTQGGVLVLAGPALNPPPIPE
jgi:fermentation-respiration switch protein FrsA (DUF1100 family)